MKIILGSKSSGRRLVMDELKKELGISYEIMSADIDEKTIRSHDPKELTLLIAKAKSEALRGKISEPIILITADTVIVQYGILMEKPISRDCCPIVDNSTV